jgi:hypothetical protein
MALIVLISGQGDSLDITAAGGQSPLDGPPTAAKSQPLHWQNALIYAHKFCSSSIHRGLEGL